MATTAASPGRTMNPVALNGLMPRTSSPTTSAIPRPIRRASEDTATPPLANRKGNLATIQKLHSRCVPSVEQLVEAVQWVQSASGDENTFRIDMRHNVYVIRTSTKIELKDVVNFIRTKSTKRASSNPQFRVLEREGVPANDQNKGRNSLEALRRPSIQGLSRTPLDQATALQTASA